MTRLPAAENGRGERVRIPADVDREDRLLAGLTARQLAILAAAAVVLWVAWAATRRLLPLPVFAGLAAPFAGAGIILAVGRWHGLPADRLLAAMLRQQLATRRLVPAPDGIPTPPPEAQHASPDGGGLRLGPLGLPVQGISADGTLDLGSEGSAVLAKATAVSFALRTPAEREALAAGYGRYLNSLASPIQVLLGAEPVDLAPIITELHTAAPGLPHPLLEAACRDHADYLQAFAASRPLLRREVLLVLRAPQPTPAQKPRRRRENPHPPVDVPIAAADGGLARVAADAAAALAGAGVTLTVLDGPAAASRLARALNPNGRRPVFGAALPDAIITAGRR
jgi:PrgI family protein